VYGGVGRGRILAIGFSPSPPALVLPLVGREPARRHREDRVVGGKHRLGAGLRRLYPDHRAVRGPSEAFSALEVDLGPFSPLARREAWRCAALGVECEAAMMALAAARHDRRTGRGRKPNAREVERLARRAGLANLSYTQAVDRLRALAAQQRRAPTPGHNALADALMSAPEIPETPA
jgi:hypothetical protein